MNYILYLEIFSLNFSSSLFAGFTIVKMKFHLFRANEKNSQRVSRSTEADSTRKPAKGTSRYLRRDVAEKRGIAINLTQHLIVSILIPLY